MTLGTKEVSIDGKSIIIGKFSAIEGWRHIHRLIKITGPAIGHFSKGDWGAGIKEVFNEVNEDELIKLIRLFTSIVLVDGKKFSDIDLSNYNFTLEVIGEVIKHNFGDFFSQALAAINGSGLMEKE
jgi:hypothetical protein